MHVHIDHLTIRNLTTVLVVSLVWHGGDRLVGLVAPHHAPSHEVSAGTEATPIQKAAALDVFKARWPQSISDYYGGDYEYPGDPPDKPLKLTGTRINPDDFVLDKRLRMPSIPEVVRFADGRTYSPDTYELVDTYSPEPSASDDKRSDRVSPIKVVRYDDNSQGTQA